MNKIYFRLPEERMVHELDCPTVEEVHDMTHLGDVPGYAFVPFRTGASATVPSLLFHVAEERSWMMQRHYMVRHIDYTSDERLRHDLYRKAFATCKTHLEAGDVSKIVLSRSLQLEMDSALDPTERFNLFISACHHYPHSYVALIDQGCSAWLIATPEVLLEERHGALRTMALAATMSIEEGRHLTPSEWSAKNREEQRVVADYIASRLDALGIPFETSEVHPKVAGQLVHLCTDFSMAPTSAIGPIVSALHPTPAVCGLPTERAAELLAGIEQHDRIYYAGFSGPVGLKAGTHLYVTLRCMQLCGAEAHLYAGGGLLAASDCESEWVETQRKLKTMLHVLQ